MKPTLRADLYFLRILPTNTNTSTPEDTLITQSENCSFYKFPVLFVIQSCHLRKISTVQLRFRRTKQKNGTYNIILQ